MQAIIHGFGMRLAQYNLPLLGLALLVCGAGSYIVAVLAARGLATRRPRRFLWLLLLVPNFGAGVWATHFIAILAFAPGPELFYALDRTLLSILVAMAGATPPLVLMLLRPRARSTPLLAGIGLGLAIGAMHFTGMSALRFCGTTGFDPLFAPLGLALGSGFAVLAVRMLLFPPGQPRIGPAALALMASTCSLHFTALLGEGIVINGGTPPAGAPGLFEGNATILAILVANVSFIILLAAFLAALTDRKIALMSQTQAEALSYFATHDELTHLPNRRQMLERLARLLRTPGQRFALHYIDIDRFKPVNSLFGHATGDKLLLQITTRLRALLGPDSMLSRVGGDEFVLLQPLPQAAPQDTSLAAAIVRAMAEPFQLEEGMIRTGASVGLVFATGGEGNTPETLLSQADMALSLAKQQSSEQLCLYEPEMSRLIAARRQLEGDLGTAIARGEMSLHYQPLCAANGTPRGFEALLRWQHHARGPISPAEFIPFAERSGHIRAIGLFVLDQACRTARCWPADLRVAVNISAVQLSDESFFDSLKAILERTGLPPRRLELEITETALIEDAARAGALLRTLHEYGVELAIDDFGTGYSNLSHLRDFCASRLKIDRSFVSGLRGDSDAASIVRAIAGLGHALNMKVLAEGVETESEFRLVRAMGCDEVQGYYLSHPMPETGILPWLSKARRPLPQALVLTD
jgi:diguanylate cyclase